MKKPVRIIAGLGNPEEKYERTLHNAGFWFVDALARKFGGHFRYEKKFDAEICRVTMHGEDVWLVKPQSYMNHSGPPVRGMLDYYRLKPAALLVAHDEIDLQPPDPLGHETDLAHGRHLMVSDLLGQGPGPLLAGVVDDPHPHPLRRQGVTHRAADPGRPPGHHRDPGRRPGLL